MRRVLDPDLELAGAVVAKHVRRAALHASQLVLEQLVWRHRRAAHLIGREATAVERDPREPVELRGGHGLEPVARKERADRGRDILAFALDENRTVETVDVDPNPRLGGSCRRRHGEDDQRSAHAQSSPETALAATATNRTRSACRCGISSESP